MTEDEALKAFFVEWSRQASEYGGYLTCEQRDCAEEAWNAALAYLRSQGEPVAFIGERDGMLWREQADAGDTPLFLAPRTIENDDREYLSAIAHLGRAMRRLVIAARTSGGTAGPDAELMAACAQAEDAMSVGAIGRAMEAPQPAIPDGWQPIETAPKDGTNVLLVNRNGNMATGLWQGAGSSEGWWIRGGAAPNVFFNGHHGPTHWMTLPHAPEPSK